MLYFIDVRTMKKIILSVAVIVTFLAYSYHQRHEGAGVVVSPSASPSSSGGSASRGSSNGNTTTPRAGGSYKDGTYTGSVADAFYGNVQVQAVIQGGRIVNVTFLQYPNDNSNSQEINSQATPLLRQEAIQAQSAQVDTITGATDTSMAFIQSLTAALAQA